MNRITLQRGKNLPPALASGRGYSEKHFSSIGLFDHQGNINGLVYLDPGNDTISQPLIIINESNGAHALPHTQRSSQLVACGASTVYRYPRKPLI